MAEEEGEDYQEKETEPEPGPGPGQLGLILPGEPVPLNPREKEAAAFLPHEKENLEAVMQLFAAGEIGWHGLMKGIDEVLHFYKLRKKLQAEALGYTTRGKCVIGLSKSELDLMVNCISGQTNLAKVQQLLREYKDKVAAMRKLEQEPDEFTIRQVENLHYQQAMLEGLDIVAKAFQVQAVKSELDRQQEELKDRPKAVQEEAESWQQTHERRRNLTGSEWDDEADD